MRYLVVLSCLLLAAPPEPVAPGVISTAAEEYRITFTPDGRTAYFARGEAFFPFSRHATIYRTDRVDGGWSTPVVAAFSGTAPDIDPAIDASGSRLFFSSIRGRDDLELFVMDRAGDGWSVPRHLGALGSAGDELYPSPAADGLYFGSDRERDAWDVWMAPTRGAGFGEPVKLGPGVNTDEYWEFNPVVSPDGTWLVFTSLSRPGGAGYGDLYASQRVDGHWQPAVPLGVNTELDEYHASFDPTGTWLYFVRRAPTETANGDLFRVRWTEALGR